MFFGFQFAPSGFSVGLLLGFFCLRKDEDKLVVGVDAPLLKKNVDHFCN